MIDRVSGRQQVEVRQAGRLDLAARTAGDEVRRVEARGSDSRRRASPGDIAELPRVSDYGRGQARCQFSGCTRERPSERRR